MNKTHIFIFFLLVLGFFLRFHNIGKYGIWQDEKQTLLIAAANININGRADIFGKNEGFTSNDFWQPKGVSGFLDAHTRGDTSGNSLIYYLTLKLQILFGGIDDANIRMVSLIMSLLLIILIYYFGKNIFQSEKVGVIGSVLVTFEPFLISYSHEARNYMMTLFFSTLASYFFILILQSNKNKNINYWLYGVCSVASLFSTYITIIILLSHFIIATLYLRDRSKWHNLIKTSAGIIISISPWMIWGPGRFFFQYVNDAVKSYKNLYVSNPNAGIENYVGSANLKFILQKSINYIIDFFPIINDIHQFGTKIGIVILIIFLCLSSLIFFKESIQRKKMLISLILIAVAPIIFQIYSSFKSDLITNFNNIRYFSFGIPIGCLMSAWLMVFLTEQKNIIFKFILPSLFGVWWVSNTYIQLQKHYQDAPNKYKFVCNRANNPHKIAAEKILHSISSKDTVFYPSYMPQIWLNATKNKETYYIDAQLTNLYLPKNATFIQKIDINEPNKIIIKNKDRKIEIFDFQGDKYRY